MKTCATCKHALEKDRDAGWWKCGRTARTIENPVTGVASVKYEFPTYCETSRMVGQKHNWAARWAFKTFDDFCMPEGRHWEPPDTGAKHGD